jgi:hypothetical protein
MKLFKGLNNWIEATFPSKELPSDPPRQNVGVVNLEEEVALQEYTVVYCAFFLERISFEQETIRAASREEVVQEAQAKCYRNQSSLKHWAFYIVN